MCRIVKDATKCLVCLTRWQTFILTVLIFWNHIGSASYGTLQFVPHLQKHPIYTFMYTMYHLSQNLQAKYGIRSFFL